MIPAPAANGSLPGRANADPGSPPLTRHIPPRASPPSPPSPSSHFVAAGLPERLGTVQRDKLSGKRETRAGEIWGRFRAAPAPRRVPGRRAADSRPAGGSSSGASGRRPPGQRELGRERGAGNLRARARERAGGRAPPREGPGSDSATVKGAMPSGLWGPPGRDRGTKLRTQKGELDAGTREGYRCLRSPEKQEETLSRTQAPARRTFRGGGALRGRGRSPSPAQEVVRQGPAPRLAVPVGSSLWPVPRRSPSPPGPAF